MKRYQKNGQTCRLISKFIRMATVFLLFCFWATSLHAAGFGVFSQGASSFGMAGSSIAHSNSPSSIFYNPALISDLEGTQVEMGTTILQLTFEHESALTGRETETDNSLHFPSTLYITHALDPKWSVGVGIFSPFGLASEWDGAWEGRYLATHSKLSSLCVNPVISYRLSSKLTLAAGVNLLYLDTDLENAVNLSPYGLNDGFRSFEGDDTVWGFNAGMRFQMTDTVSFGASYRSGYEVDLDGDIAFDLPVEGATLIRQYLPDTSAMASIDLPQVAFVGMAWQVHPQLILETGFLWEGWSDYETVTTKFDTPIFGMTSDVLIKNWKDTITVNLGGEYFLSDRYTFRAGYIYRENAVPDETFEPSLPDADAHLFALGGDLHWSTNYTLSFAYVYERQKSRDKVNFLGDPLGGNANGTYRSDIHFLALSLNWHF